MVVQLGLLHLKLDPRLAGFFCMFPPLFLIHVAGTWCARDIVEDGRLDPSQEPRHGDDEGSARDARSKAASERVNLGLENIPSDP
jgi:hypothetical protein